VIQKKVCLLGAFSVGKTSLIQRYVNSIFDEKYLTTVGVKIDKKLVEVDQSKVMLMVWDLAGEDDFTDIKTAYLRGSSGAILVIDGTRAATFDVAKRIHTMLTEKFADIKITVALNKSDLQSDWEVDETDVLDHFSGLAQVWKTSAKTGDSVEALFESLSKDMLVVPPKAA